MKASLDAGRSARQQQQAAAQHRAIIPAPHAPALPPPGPALWSWSLICACNMNRSTSGHDAVRQLGYQRVTSYGTSDAVRLPGRGGATHAFPFGTRYADILARMVGGDASMAAWMAQFGLSAMLQRNAGLKDAPEAWQALSDAAVRGRDFVICFDRAVYNEVLKGACGLRGECDGGDGGGGGMWGVCVDALQGAAGC